MWDDSEFHTSTESTTAAEKADVNARDAIRRRRAIALAYGGSTPADITMLAP